MKKVSGVVILLNSTDTAGFCGSLKNDYSEYEYRTGYRPPGTGQNAEQGSRIASDTTENTDNVNTQQTGNGHLRTVCSLMEASTGQVIYEKDADSRDSALPS